VSAAVTASAVAGWELMRATVLAREPGRFLAAETAWLLTLALKNVAVGAEGPNASLNSHLQPLNEHLDFGEVGRPTRPSRSRV
jgi:hypothetical protein